MNRQELSEAVGLPAHCLGVSVEHGLTERILAAVSAEEGRLPLLEFALTLLWEKQEGNCLTHAAYDQIGGVAGALVQYAEQEYASLGAAERDEAAKVFVQMVDPGKGTEDTRRRAGRKELGEEKWKLVTRLANARLVVTGRDKSTGVEAVELVHETLLKNWGRLREWVAGDRQFRTWQERLRTAMRLWDANGKDRGGLLRGAALVEANSWLKKRRDDISRSEQEFIRASAALRNWSLGITVLGVLVIAVLAAVIAAAGLRVPARPPSVATLPTQLPSVPTVDATENVYDRYPEMIQSAREQGDVRRARKLLAELRRKNWGRSEGFWWYYSWKQCHRDSHTLTHKKEVRAVAFSPDGGKLASAVGDWKKSGTISLWGRDGIKEVYSREDNICSLAFSRPDGLQLAAGTRDGEVVLLDLNKDGTKAKERPLGKHDGSVYAVAFSPDGRSLASVSGDAYSRTVEGQLKIWDKTGDSWKERASVPGEKRGFRSVAWLSSENLASATWDGPVCLRVGATGQFIRSFGNATAEFTSVAVSPDGSTLAASEGDTIELWGLPPGSQPGELVGRSRRVTALAFASDTTLMSGGLDGTIRQWDVASQKLLDTLIGHNALVTCLAMHPDGRTLASGSQDGTTKVWELSAVGRDVLKLEKAVHAVALSDGGLLASGAEEGWVQLWDVANTKDVCRYQTPDSYVMGAAFSPDAKHWITGDSNGNVRLWDTKACNPPALLGQHGAVYCVAISPDGRLAATASGTRDPTVMLWNLATNEHWPLSPTHEGAVYGVAFSPSGRWLVSVSGDHNIRLWDLSTGTKSPPCVHTIPTDTIIWSVCFISDQTLATGHENGTVRLWDVTALQNQTPVQTLRCHTGRVFSVAFTSKRRTLASGSEDGSVQLWNYDGKTCREVADLRGHNDRVYSVAFSADGTTLASGSADTTVRLWRAATEEEVKARLSEDIQLLDEK
jgi:WD40 repeat protein